MELLDTCLIYCKLLNLKLEFKAAKFEEKDAPLETTFGKRPIIFGKCLGTVQLEGVFLSEYEVKLPLPSIAGPRYQPRKYYEVWGIAGSYDPEWGHDADPCLIEATTDTVNAFMALVHTVLEEKLANALDGEELAKAIKDGWM